MRTARSNFAFFSIFLHGYKCVNVTIHVCTVTAEIITVPQVVKSLLLVKNCSKELSYKEEEGSCRCACSYVQREKS